VARLLAGAGIILSSLSIAGCRHGGDLLVKNESDHSIQFIVQRNEVIPDKTEFKDFWVPARTSAEFAYYFGSACTVTVVQTESGRTLSHANYSNGEIRSNSFDNVWFWKVTNEEAFPFRPGPIEKVWTQTDLYQGSAWVATFLLFGTFGLVIWNRRAKWPLGFIGLRRK